MAYKRPGVYVEESLIQSSPAFFPASSIAAFVGVASRGPTTATRVDSWMQYQRIYGGFEGTDQTLAHAVYSFFNNGGGSAYIVRATGSSIVTATRTLNDRQGTPAAILKVDAANGGAWGNSIYVEITNQPGTSRSYSVASATDLFTSTGHGLTAGTPVVFASGPAGITAGTQYYVIAAGLTADAFKVSATAGGATIDVTADGSGTYVNTTGRFNITVRYGGTGDSYIVERWTDLTLDPDDARYAPTLINSSVAGSGSQYIAVTDMFDHAGATPYDPLVYLPAATVAGGEALTTGANGSAPTGGATGQMYTAVTQLASVEDFLVINVPGVTETALVNAIIAFVEGMGTSFLVVDCQAGRSPSQAIADANAYTDSSYAAVYWPRLSVADPASTVAGATRTIPPGGAVVGQIVNTDSIRGVHKAPAGLANRINGVVALEYKALETDLDSLNVAQVNAIRSVPGAGFCIFGARTLKTTQVDRFINVRRSLTSLRMALVSVTRFAVFEPNDEALWEAIEDACGRVLLQFWQEGGLRGSSSGDAYYVACNSDTNPQSSINNGEVHIEVGVALQTPAEFIVLRIGQFANGSTVTEEF